MGDSGINVDNLLRKCVCGGHARILMHEPLIKPDAESWSIQCSDCGKGIDKVPYRSIAVARWNKMQVDA